MAFSFFKKDKPAQEPKSDHYFNLKVKEVVRETPDAIRIVFEQPQPVITFRSGQFLTLIKTIGEKEVRRAYSICSSPYVEQDTIEVSVKRVENGLMSNHLNDTLKAGETIKVMEPMGNFTTEFKADQKRHLIMFAGGSGITPMMSIIKSLLVQEPESIVSLVYCNRNVESIIFKSELENLQTKYEGRLRVIHVLDNAPMNWQGYSGLLNHDMLVKLFERIPNWGLDSTTYLMCGPEGMMNNVTTLLEGQGIPKNKTFKESFVSGTINKEEKVVAASSDAIISRVVTVVYDGQDHKFTVKPDSTILETALDLGIDLPFSCQSGLCTACRGKLISGRVKLDEEEGLSDSELAEGYVLTCVGHPLTDDVKIQIG